MSGLATTTRWVYPFEDGSAEMRELLGNKGANLAEMTRVLGAEKVPGGFTVTTAPRGRSTDRAPPRQIGRAHV